MKSRRDRLVRSPCTTALGRGASARLSSSGWRETLPRSVAARRVALFTALSRSCSTIPATALARSPVRRTASRCTFDDRTADIATDTASTTRRSVPAPLAATRAGIDRRLSRKSEAPTPSAAAARTQSDAGPASVASVTTSATASTSRPAPNSARGTSSASHRSQPMPRAATPARPRATTPGPAASPTTRDPRRNAPRPTATKPPASAARGQPAAVASRGRRSTTARPAPATRNVANSAAKRSWAAALDTIVTLRPFVRCLHGPIGSFAVVRRD